MYACLLLVRTLLLQKHMLFPFAIRSSLKNETKWDLCKQGQIHHELFGEFETIGPWLGHAKHILLYVHLVYSMDVSYEFFSLTHAYIFSLSSPILCISHILPIFYVVFDIAVWFLLDMSRYFNDLGRSWSTFGFRLSSSWFDDRSRTSSCSKDPNTGLSWCKAFPLTLIVFRWVSSPRLSASSSVSSFSERSSVSSLSRVRSVFPSRWRPTRWTLLASARPPSIRNWLTFEPVTESLAKCL